MRVGISVEGQTEEIFVKRLLAPHLATFEVHMTPIIVTTSRSASGTKAKGGGINTERIKGELRRLLEGFKDGYVTSLYDLYGFEDKLPGESAEALETRIADLLGRPNNLLAYIQSFEFESLLLSDPASAATYFQAQPLQRLIEDAVGRAGSPKRVNDGPTSAPSKRLQAWTEKYAPNSLLHYSKGTKTRHGPSLASHITLAKIRLTCKRFDMWLTQIESLSDRRPEDGIA